MASSDYKNLTEADYENLPPLVPAGEDREAILDRVVEGWVSIRAKPDVLTIRRVIEKHPATLKRLDLRDDNPDAEPIDLGDLIRRTAEAAAKRGVEARIALLGCRVRECLAGKMDRIPAIHLFGCRFSGDAYFRSSTFSGYADFESSTFIDGADFESSTFSGYANFRSSTFSAYAAFDSSTFSASAYFRSSTFSGDADFDSSTFSASADFRSSTFSGFAFFPLSKFSHRAHFRSSTFSDGADFRSSTFSGRADFGSSTFSGETDFESSTFSGDADFRSSTFSGLADFQSSTFSGFADFRSSTFSGLAFFPLSKFSHRADFGSSTFRDDADFGSSTFSGPADFRSSTFGKRPIFHRADFRAAEVRDIGRIVQARPVGNRIASGLFGGLQWGWVRAVGRLQALTRASYWALLAVPILAGVWPVVRWTINEYNNAANGEPLAQTMPLTWFLAFAAALAVAVGHFVYQSRAPQLIQEATVDDLTDRAEEITRQDGRITEERMRAAIDELQQAADMRPHDRSAWFVKRGSRWVWLPHELELYRDIDAKENDGGAWRPGGASAKAAPEATDPDRAAGKQEVSAADRKRILIEEGEKARYEQAVHERPAWAWAAGGCYLLGGWFILCIVLMQTAAVAAAAGWGRLDNWLDQWNPYLTLWVALGIAGYSALAIGVQSGYLGRWAKAAGKRASRGLAWARQRLAAIRRRLRPESGDDAA